MDGGLAQVRRMAELLARQGTLRTYASWDAAAVIPRKRESL